MGRSHSTDAAGRRVDLIGKPVEYRLAPIPNTGVGVRTVGQEEIAAMAKAESNGEYVLNGNHFVIRKGDAIPDGAEFISSEPTDVEPEVRAVQAAPENKSRKSAPENKSA